MATTILESTHADWQIRLFRPLGFGPIRVQTWYVGNEDEGPQHVGAGWFWSRDEAVEQATEWIEAEEAEYAEKGYSEGVDQW